MNKYNVGDKFWELEQGKAVQKPVVSILILKDGVYYSLEPLRGQEWNKRDLDKFVASNFSEYAWKTEDQLFATKEELISSL